MFLSFLTVMFMLAFCFAAALLFADIISIKILKSRNAKQPSSKTEHRIGMYRKHRRNVLIVMAVLFALVLLCSIIGVFVLR